MVNENQSPLDGPSPGTARDASRLEEALDLVESAGGALQDAECKGADKEQILGYLNSAHEILDKELQTAQPSLSEAKGPSPSSPPTAMDLDLWLHGYAPGSVAHICARCDAEFDGAKGSSRCETCAAGLAWVRSAAPGAPPLPRPMGDGRKDQDLEPLARLGGASRLPATLRGDGPCSDCGTHDNIVWFTDNVIWNMVCRRPEDAMEPILCIPCFVKRTDAAGYWPVAWRLLPEWHHETKEDARARKGGTLPGEEIPLDGSLGGASRRVEPEGGAA